MSCTTCTRRRVLCNRKRPRCLTCKNSHLKCTYDEEPQTLEFVDESASVIQSHPQLKRRKKSHQSTDRPISFDRGEDINNDSELASVISDSNTFPDDVLLNFEIPLDFSQWSYDFYDNFSLEANAFPPPQIGDANGSIDHGNAVNNEYPLVTTEYPAYKPLVLEPHVDHHLPDLKIQRVEEVQRPKIPVHILAQHYARNLAGRFSSKSAEWTFYTYFLNRYTTSHPFVLSAMLALSSANLTWSKPNETLENALTHYDECFHTVSMLLDVELLHIETSGQSQLERLNQSLANVSDDDLDAVFVACFFLAIFDLMTVRHEQLLATLRLISNIIHIRIGEKGISDICSRVATWFCVLDARASAFGLGDGAVLRAIGGESGVTKALYTSSDLLQREYSIIYPKEQKMRDEVHLPLLAKILQLVALFVEISRCASDGAENMNHLRNSLDGYREAVENSSEFSAPEKKVYITWNVLVAWYNTVEVYFSRIFFPSADLHSADHFAIEIIRASERMISSSKSSYSEPPKTKLWPLPLTLAAIEVRDPVYRSWALGKFRDYDESGEIYVKSKALVEKVWEYENITGERANIGDIMKGMNLLAI